MTVIVIPQRRFQSQFSIGLEEPNKRADSVLLCLNLQVLAQFLRGWKKLIPLSLEQLGSEIKSVCCEQPLFSDLESQKIKTHEVSLSRKKLFEGIHFSNSNQVVILSLVV